MGGSFKGGGGGGGNKGRSYGIILLVAFGAAIMGVMAIHKLRERRIFNLLIKDKDQQLLSLQLLLQKERDLTKELRNKREQMNANIFSLRTQKMELNSRVLEMQSTISSLKDEQRALESALEEKQNEIKMIRGKEVVADKESSQVTTLTGILKQKVAEIEQLKNRLGHPDRIWSVSSDDPSKPSTNLTATTEDLTMKGTIENESSNNQGDQSEGDSGNGVRREMAGEKVRHSQEAENSRGLEGERENSTTKTEGTDPGNKENETATKKDEEDEVSRNGLQQNPVNSGNVEGQKSGKVSREVNKIERTVDSRHDGISKGRGHKNFSRTKGQRWRMIARKRGLEQTASVKTRKTSQRDSKKNGSENGGLRIRTSHNPEELLGELEAVINAIPRARESFSEPKLLKPQNTKDKFQQLDDNNPGKKEESKGSIENGRLQAKAANENDELIEDNIHQNQEEDIIDDGDVPERFDTEMQEARDEYKEEADESEF